MVLECQTGVEVAVKSAAGPRPGAPLRVAVVGAGNRSIGYARYALNHPDRMRIVAVADPDRGRVQTMAQKHGIAPAMCFDSYEALAEHRGDIDAVINGTMDDLHFRSTVALLEAGFDVLLEKPIAGTEAEVRGLIEMAHRLKRTVMICHVLRYAPFYDRVKSIINSGRLGRILNIRTSEHVAYHHMATAFVRGKWNNTASSNPMILAKCCHDLDLLAWYLEGDAPTRVASFGRLSHFRPDQAPTGATDRCLDGCPHEPTCPYSAKALYVDQDLWSAYVWDTSVKAEPPAREDRLKLLQADNPYGRCVWRCDNNVVDHQSVIVEFTSGATASHDMICTSARPSRKVQITGTQGELEGELHDSIIQLRFADPRNPDLFRHERIDLASDKKDLAGHGGGDSRLIADFVSTVTGSSDAAARTRLDASLHGHLIAFAAERSMQERRTIDIAP